MQNEYQNLPKFFWHFIKRQKLGFALLLPSSFSWAIQTSIYPFFIQLIIDKATKYSNNKDLLFQQLSFILIVLIGTWVLIDIGYRLYDFASARVLPKFQAQIRSEMFHYTFEHSHRYFSDHFAGAISSRISRMPVSMSQIINLFIMIFIPITIAFCINSFILYLAKPIFGIISFLWFSLHLTVTLFYTTRCRDYSIRHSEAVTSLNGKILDTLSNMINVKLFSHRRYEIQYNDKFQQDEIQKNFDLLQFNAWMKLGLGCASLTVFFIMVLLGIWSFQQDLITLGELALILTSLNIMGLAWYMSGNFINLFQEVGNCKEAMQLIQQPHEIIDEKNAADLLVTRGEIVFDHVTFYYDKERALFKDKIVNIQPGEKVGLVGFSGSGKTTFVNLILRFFEPVNGKILIDNQDIQYVRQESLRKNISLIPQDPFLFHRTLMENIRYGRLDAADEEVISASNLAHCHEFIQNLKDGYSTMVGERGIKLSGGQRQRIAIARALLKNAPILILDEATSSLDSITEQYIQDSLNTLMKGKTTIIIAHRLSTLSSVDRILVFKEGKIIEEGTHDALLKMNGHYALLWSKQMYGFLPDTLD